MSPAVRFFRDYPFHRFVGDTTADSKPACLIGEISSGGFPHLRAANAAFGFGHRHQGGPSMCVCGLYCGTNTTTVLRFAVGTPRQQLV